MQILQSDGATMIANVSDRSEFGLLGVPTATAQMKPPPLLVSTMNHRYQPRGDRSPVKAPTTSTTSWVAPKILIKVDRSTDWPRMARTWSLTNCPGQTRQSYHLSACRTAQRYATGDGRYIWQWELRHQTPEMCRA